MTETCCAGEPPGPPSTPTGAVSEFLREKGMNSQTIDKMLRRCVALTAHGAVGTARQNWAILVQEAGVAERKLAAIAGRCPKILAAPDPRQALRCLEGLGAKPSDVAAAIARFPRLLVCSMEERLCPLLAFLEGAGVPQHRIGKVVLACPRLVSYSIHGKLEKTVKFLRNEIGITERAAMGKVIMKWPYIFGYGVESRLRRTAGFLTMLGLGKEDMVKVVQGFPQMLCRSEMVMRRNVEHLEEVGFGPGQVAAMIRGHPPILVASIANSLQPKLDFFLHTMGKSLADVASCPSCFACGLHKSIRSLYLKLKLDENGNTFSLDDLIALSTSNLKKKKRTAFHATTQLANLTI